MNLRHHFKIRLTFKGPLLTKATSPATFGLDAAMARVAQGPDRGKPCIPGTVIEGKLREALHQLSRAGHFSEDQINMWFGRPTDDDFDQAPKPGSLHIHDLHAVDEPASSSVRHSIAIDPETGAVETQMLRVIETPFDAGERITLVGPAYAYGGEAPYVRKNLETGLRWLTQAGALRSVGFGSLIGAEVTMESPLPMPPSKHSVNTRRIAVELCPTGPLCIARHKIGDNLFESEDFIPGNMLAGAVMQTANRLNIPLPGFDEVVFHHARASLADRPRPKAIPLSLAEVDGTIHDFRDLPTPNLFQTGEGQWTAPAFQPDWKGKHYAWANEKLGIPQATRELKVRTKIHSEHRTADRGQGEGGKLFAWEVVHPFTEQGEPLTWKSIIDLSEVGEQDHPTLIAGLQQALSQLGYLSKTKADCTASLDDASHPPPYSLNENSSIALVLQTPALLMDPRFQSECPEERKHFALDAAETTRLYQATWHDLCGDALALSHHFSQQFLAGGNHLGQRFQASQNKPYQPWLLTQAGSVFVFKVSNATLAKEHIDSWLARGLPLPQWAIQPWGDHWKENPYQRQNGFGEIRLADDAFPKPSDDLLRPISLTSAS